MTKRKRRSGTRPKRAVGIRRECLGHYIIVTDAKKTEAAYFEGLRSSLPPAVQDRLVLKVVSGVPASKLVQKARDIANTSPQYAEVWIVLDKDYVPDFDRIVGEASSVKNVFVGWSNPCIEIWFESYFRNMRCYPSHVQCVPAFKTLYKQKTGREYRKNDQAIHHVLETYGDESAAVKRASQRMENHRKNGILMPSQMSPGTRVYELIQKIKEAVSP